MGEVLYKDLSGKIITAAYKVYDKITIRRKIMDKKIKIK